MDNADRESGDMDKVEKLHRELADLMARVRAGDEAALGEVLREWSDPLLRVIRRILEKRKLCSRVGAEDILQSLFVEFWEGIHSGAIKIVTDEDVKKALFHLLGCKLDKHTDKHNAGCRDVHREDKRTAAELDLPARQPGPAEIAESADMEAAFIERLDPLERYVLEQRLNGQTWPEVARQVDRTDDALRQRLARAWMKVAPALGFTFRRRRPA